jgi:RNA polymerase I-specific transcription initiation factor RRN7
LHYWGNRLAKLYSQEFNITFPSINYPPILWKYTKTLSLPIETYSIAMRISKLLGLTEFRLAEEAKYQRSHGTPDSKLVALLIVACKLGFDLERTSAWKEWANATDEEKGMDRNAGKDDIVEKDILEMSDDKLDEYMDWIQSTWLDDAEEERKHQFHLN